MGEVRVWCESGVRDRDSGRRIGYEPDEGRANGEEYHDVEEDADFSGRSPPSGDPEWGRVYRKAMSKSVDLSIAGISVRSEQIVVPLCSTGQVLSLWVSNVLFLSPEAQDESLSASLATHRLRPLTR